MNKEEALGEFLKGLRIVLNNALAYNKDHPYFRKSAETFKEKVDALFPFLNPIKINIAPDSLFIDGVAFEKLALYVDLATMFHMRKIKTIQIRQGLGLDELIDFLSSIALPVKEILKKGGLGEILKDKEAHVYVEDLDYSSLLQTQGEESKDIWVYLFNQVIAKDDAEKAGDFANNFESIISRFRAKELFEDDDLRQAVFNFLNYLKEKGKGRFYNCVRGLFKLALRDGNIPLDEKLDKVKIFLQDFDNKELADILFEEISEEEGFNFLSFKVFSQLIGTDKHKEIAPILEGKVKDSEVLKNNPKIRKKLKELFSLSDPSYATSFYRNIFYSISEGAELEEDMLADFENAEDNYHFILLNLFENEKGKEKSSLVSRQLLKECNNSVEKGNVEYLKRLRCILDKKSEEEGALTDASLDLDRCISNFVESSCFENNVKGIEELIATLKKSYSGLDSYLDKIFNEAKVNAFSLRLFLRFFPDKLDLFYQNLEKKRADLDFLAKMINSLEKLDTPLVLEIFKKIFSFSNNLIKIEILKSMQNLRAFDEKFLLSILETGEAFLKKEALLILSREQNVLERALDKLLSIKSPWGKKNKIIMENITVIEELKLRSAQEYLFALTKRPFFWNSNIRKRAKEALAKITC